MGDFYQGRAFFHIFMALAASPRFIQLFANFQAFQIQSKNNLIYSVINRIALVVGIFRAISAGLFTYITSSNNLRLHEIGMFSYVTTMIGYHILVYSLNKRFNPSLSAVRNTKLIGLWTFVVAIFMVYFFVQHKVHQVAGGIY